MAKARSGLQKDVADLFGRVPMEDKGISGNISLRGSPADKDLRRQIEAVIDCLMAGPNPQSVAPQ